MGDDLGGMSTWLMHVAGTYQGLVEKLNYLQKLGINAIELQPVQEFNELEYYEVSSCW